MRLRDHVILGTVAAVSLYPLWGAPRSLLFLLAAVFIDVDHYIDYLWRTKGKDWRPSQMFRYYEKFNEHMYDSDNLGFSLFHTLEIFILLFLLAYYINYVFFITIIAGMLFHMVLDMLWLAYYRIFLVRPYSLIEYFLRRNHRIKKGLHPQSYYDRMFSLSQDAKKELK